MWLKAVLIDVILLLAIVMEQVFGDIGGSVPDVSRKDLLREFPETTLSLCMHIKRDVIQGVICCLISATRREPAPG